MPLDISLIKYVHESSRRHIAMSSFSTAHSCHNTRFSFTMQKEVLYTYCQVFDLVEGAAPTPKGIAKDIEKVVRAMKVIHEHQRMFVSGLTCGHVENHLTHKDLCPC